MIPFDFVLKIKFDRDFIVQNDARERESVRGTLQTTFCFQDINDSQEIEF